MDGEGPRSALLDPLEPLPNPVGFTTPARAPTGQSTDFRHAIQRRGLCRRQRYQRAHSAQKAPGRW